MGPGLAQELPTRIISRMEWLYLCKYSLHDTLIPGRRNRWQAKKTVGYFPLLAVYLFNCFLCVCFASCLLKNLVSEWVG